MMNSKEMQMHDTMMKTVAAFHLAMDVCDRAAKASLEEERYEAFSEAVTREVVQIQEQKRQCFVPHDNIMTIWESMEKMGFWLANHWMTRS